MPNQVSGLAGYNVYLPGPTWVSSSGPPGPANGGVKQNQTPIADGTELTLSGLASATDYTTMIGVTSVDKAGNERQTAVSPPTGTAVTLNPRPDQVPMNSTKVAAIDAFVAASMATSGALGVNVAVVGPMGYMFKAYGSGGNGAMNTDDHMRMGSITKTFTATAIFREVDKGTLSLDDTLEQYVPGVPNGTIMTIRNMLMMQSGVVDDQTNAALQQALVLSPTGGWSPDTTLAYIKTGGSSFTPGTAYQYTNSNYILLGYVLKAVTGRPPQDILTNDIIGPLSLLETSWPTTSGLLNPWSHGYWTNPLASIPIIGLLFSNDITNMNPEFFDAAGALITTVGDLVAWGKELRDGTLLSSEMQTQRMDIAATGPGVQAFAGPSGPVTYDYGMGIYLIGSWFGHDGSVPGFDSAIMFEPATGTVIAIIENRQTVGLQALANIWYKIAEYLLPGSTFNARYLQGGPFTGGTTGSLHPVSTAIAGSMYNPTSVVLPFDLPGTFAFTVGP